MHFTTPSATQNDFDERMLWKEHAAVHAIATVVLATIQMIDKTTKDTIIATLGTFLNWDSVHTETFYSYRQIQMEANEVQNDYFSILWIHL